MSIDSLSYLSGLNPAQLRAVHAVYGPVLVLAAAGTGKTRTLVSRIAYILSQAISYPNELLVVTFTNKAASEMSERVSEFVQEKIEWLGTFHSIAARILRIHAEKVGLKPNFTILDQSDQLEILKNITSEEYPDLREKCKIVLEKIQRWKDQGLLPSMVKPSNYHDRDYIEIYTKYQSRMSTLNSCDFGDLLLLNILLFENHHEILEYYQKKFRYIMVDEYQDTNSIQYIWLTTLAKMYRNICVVGDDDQSIYSWRGAEVKNILNFPEEYPDAEVIRLERNYRSTKHILAVASTIIANNTSRLRKDLWTEKLGGNKVTIIKLRDSEDEANCIAHTILKMKSGELSSNTSYAVLVRATFQMRAIEDAFVRYSIPHKIIGGTKFYARQEIRDILSYLRLIVNNDDFMAFDRIINRPRRGIGAMTLKKIYNRASEDNTSPLKALTSLIEEDAMSKAAIPALKKFINNILKCGEQYQEFTVSDLIKNIISDFDYTSFIQNDNDKQSKFENLDELISVARDFENANTFLEHTSLSSNLDSKSNADEVSIMTLHASKGLEFPCVFLPGWEEGVFPHQKSISSRSDSNELEEERRLAYVGITRAREKLFILRSSRRAINNYWQNSHDSRFIREILSEQMLQQSIDELTI